MTTTLAVKEKIVKEVSQVANNAVSAVLAEYRGLTSNQMNELRVSARKNGIYMRVVPNNLAKRAFSGTTFECLSERLVGPLIIALSLESPGASARVLKDFAKTNEILKMQALAVGGKVYGVESVDFIASLPTKQEALAKLLYVFKAPIEKFVRTLKEPHAKLVRLLAAIKDKKAAQ